MNNQLSFEIQKAIRRYEPIKVGAHTLFPVKVRDYEPFQLARYSLEALQQSFPVALMSVPFLQAVYQLDYEAAVKGEPVSGLFSSTLLGLALALRLGEGLDVDGRLKQFSVKVDPQKPERLKSVTALLNGEEMVEITPVQYAKLRPIIAAQNGVKQYSEDANPDLVEAEKVIASQGVQLTGGIEDEIDFVGLLNDSEDIDEWAILKLHNKSTAMKRVLDYVVCGINEGAGCTWKGGNPAPHPWLEKEHNGSGGVVAASDFMGGAGERAIQNEGETTTL